MRWTTWFIGRHYAYRRAGNGAFVELGYFPNNEIEGDTVFLQGDDAANLVDALDQARDSQHIDNLIDPYFDTSWE
jgi:hypothetical protein